MDEWHAQDFRLYNPTDPNEKGVTYADEKKTWIDMGQHTTITDIIDTSIHESIHAAIFRLCEDNHSDDAEHLMIRIMEWAASGMTDLE